MSRTAGVPVWCRCGRPCGDGDAGSRRPLDRGADRPERVSAVLRGARGDARRRRARPPRCPRRWTATVTPRWTSRPECWFSSPTSPRSCARSRPGRAAHGRTRPVLLPARGRDRAVRRRRGALAMSRVARRRPGRRAGARAAHRRGPHRPGLRGGRAGARRGPAHRRHQDLPSLRRAPAGRAGRRPGRREPRPGGRRQGERVRRPRPVVAFRRTVAAQQGSLGGVVRRRRPFGGPARGLPRSVTAPRPPAARWGCWSR